jgi:hypothetical protein
MTPVLSRAVLVHFNSSRGGEWVGPVCESLMSIAIFCILHIEYVEWFQSKHFGFNPNPSFGTRAVRFMARITEVNVRGKSIRVLTLFLCFQSHGLGSKAS